MTITHNDILATAKRLSVVLVDGVGPSESDLRSVASRAYYATLHAASDAIPEDLQPSEEKIFGAGSHKAIIDAVILWSKSVRPGRSEAIVVARNLAKLKHARKKADYFLNQNFSVHDADTALRIAILTIDSAERGGRQAKVPMIA